jgi:hypothetical protein
VLEEQVMKRALAAAAGLIAVSTTASADGYLGLGLGTQPAINDEVTAFATPVGRSVRGLAGIRFGRVSLEGALNGFDMVTHSNGDTTAYQLSAALKLSFPLGNNFEAFGRVGLERTWLNLHDPNLDLTGDGLLVGGGFEYRLNAIVSNASIFVDYNVHRATLDSQSNTKVDATTRMLGLGFTVGI